MVDKLSETLAARSNLYSALRLGAGLLTVAAIVISQYLPDKTLKVLPSENTYHSIYWDWVEGIEPGIYWVNENADHLHCSFHPPQKFSCGYSLTFNVDHSLGLDLRDYQSVRIKLSYRGDEQRIRLFMRNYNAKTEKGDPLDVAKFMSTIIRTTDFETETLVQLSEFSVAEWWVRQFDVPRKQAAPQRDNVVTFGLDFMTPGEHDVKIEKIEFVGPWISQEAFYLSILCLWMALIIWEGISRFYYVYRESSRSKQKISELSESYRQLEMEKQQLAHMSTTDALTQVANRAGILQVVERLFANKLDASHVGFMLIDVDHFKRINDTRGHDIGDEVLRRIAQLVSGKIRQSDVFGRWGGEEFAVICEKTSEANFLSLAEKICAAVAGYDFFPSEKLCVTISIGAVIAGDSANFDAVYNRADLALYQAKHQGRNCVVMK